MALHVEEKSVDEMLFAWRQLSGLLVFVQASGRLTISFASRIDNEGLTLLAHDVKESADDFRVELRTGVLMNLGHDGLARDSLPIRPIRRHCFDSVGQADDAGF